jgi:hypothetical protein
MTYEFNLQFEKFKKELDKVTKDYKCFRIGKVGRDKWTEDSITCNPHGYELYSEFTSRDKKRLIELYNRLVEYSKIAHPQKFTQNEFLDGIEMTDENHGYFMVYIAVK